MILLVQYKELSHLYHFVDEGITSDQSGTQTLNLRLFHDRNNDYEAFTKQVYLSVPLKIISSYYGKEIKSVSTSIHTKKEKLIENLIINKNKQ